MPYVNLIQEQRLVTQSNERKARSFFFVFVGSLAMSGLAYAFLGMETLLVSRQADSILAQNKKNEPLVKQIDQNAKALAELTPRLKTLQDASDMTGRWNRILSCLTIQTPPSVWLTDIRCTSSDPTKPIQLGFVGVASSQSPVGEFILRLQNFKDLENVTLKGTNEKLVATSREIEFEVDSDLAGTAEQKVKTEDGAGK